VILSSHNVFDHFIFVQSDQNWEVDLDDMEASIDEKTKAVVINNPSNPCGE
jgi:tyrosine aminotransferase